MCDTLKRIDKARWWLLTKQPFYGSLTMSLADVIDPSIATACTDGRVIRWNPGFVDTLNDEELRFTLLHETLHCAHMHMWRLPTDQTGNAAGDYAINETISVLDGISMPEGCLLDAQYKGMSEEEIYAKLSAPPPPPKPGGDKGDPGDEKGEPGDGQPKPGGDPGDQPGGQPGDGQPQPGSGAGGGGKQKRKKPQPGDQPGQPSDQPDDGDGDGDGDGNPSQGGKPDHSKCSHFAPNPNPDADQAQQDIDDAKLREEWEQRVIQAAQAAQAMGHGEIPADMDRLLDRMRSQEVDWRREMADFVKNSLSTRNDWSRSARRHTWQKVIYPRRYTDSVGAVVFVRDTSGSVDDKLCAEFTALITSCVAEMNCEGIVLDCDMQIKAEHRVSPQEECPAQARGGGGTDLRPPFNRADELEAEGEQIAGIIYLTDLDASSNRIPTESSIPTLWLATTDLPEPFGRVVRIRDSRRNH